MDTAMAFLCHRWLGKANRQSSKTVNRAACVEASSARAGASREPGQAAAAILGASLEPLKLHRSQCHFG